MSDQESATESLKSLEPKQKLTVRRMRSKTRETKSQRRRRHREERRKRREKKLERSRRVRKHSPSPADSKPPAKPGKKYELLGFTVEVSSSHVNVYNKQDLLLYTYKGIPMFNAKVGPKAMIIKQSTFNYVLIGAYVCTFKAIHPIQSLKVVDDHVYALDAHLNIYLFDKQGVMLAPKDQKKYSPAFNPYNYYADHSDKIQLKPLRIKYGF